MIVETYRGARGGGIDQELCGTVCRDRYGTGNEADQNDAYNKQEALIQVWNSHIGYSAALS